MTREGIALLVLAAVLAFWMVGAYNRLVILRNDIGQAWAKVDDALRQRGAAAEPLLADLRAPLESEQGSLDTWQAALAEAARAAAQMAARPVDTAHAAAWVAAEAALAGAASRVFALLEQHAELRLQEPVAGHATTWRDAGARLAFARQVFNEAAQAYNSALVLFPTRLLVGMFGFGAAGRI